MKAELNKIDSFFEIIMHKVINSKQFWKEKETENIKQPKWTNSYHKNNQELFTQQSCRAKKDSR